jgi:hypothetical protein
LASSFQSVVASEANVALAAPSMTAMQLQNRFIPTKLIVHAFPQE